MLARPNRLTRGEDYRTVVRRGVKSAGAHAVAYVVDSGESRPARFGFIISKKVGNAVVRNTVRRRMKALCAAGLPSVRPGADVVFRALPSAATAEYLGLSRDVDRALARCAA